MNESGLTRSMSERCSPYNAFMKGASDGEDRMFYTRSWDVTVVEFIQELDAYPTAERNRIKMVPAQSPLATDRV